jgi:hypothetical protein
MRHALGEYRASQPSFAHRNQSRYVHCEMQVLGGEPFDGQSSNAGQGLPGARDFSIPFPAVSVQGRQC